MIVVNYFRMNTAINKKFPAFLQDLRCVLVVPGSCFFYGTIAVRKTLRKGLKKMEELAEYPEGGKT